MGKRGGLGLDLVREAGKFYFIILEIKLFYITKKIPIFIPIFAGICFLYHTYCSKNGTSVILHYNK